MPYRFEQVALTQPLRLKLQIVVIATNRLCHMVSLKLLEIPMLFQYLMSRRTRQTISPHRPQDEHTKLHSSQVQRRRRADAQVDFF